ncbi:MAG: hypothetical protein WKF37_25150 [Bryobacteraceae bacterium]
MHNSADSYRGILQAQEYDLVLKGGHLLDPKNNINGRRDIAIARAELLPYPRVLMRQGHSR